MWSAREIDSITTPAIHDARGRAVLRVVADLLQDYLPRKLRVQDAQTCALEILPALIAERSMEEFIDPDLSEQVQRNILDREYELKRLKGYDAGVILGMQLLGFVPKITHWHQTEPKGPANTHVLKVFAKDAFDADTGAFSPVDIRAINRMNDATKRWSQETELRLGIALPDGDKPSFGTGCVVAFRERIEVQPVTTDTYADDAPIPLGTAIQTNAMFTIEEAA